MLYVIILVIDSIYKILSVPGTKINRFITSSGSRSKIFNILGFFIDLSHLVWILSGSLSISSGSKKCMNTNTLLILTLLFVFILVMMNLAKCVVQLLALLFLSLGNIFNLNNNDWNENHRVPLIDANEGEEVGGLSLSEIRLIKRIRYRER